MTSSDPPANPDILITDDQSKDVAFVCTLLQQEGYSVRLAVNCNDALEMFHEKLPALILSNTCLPGINGQELCPPLHAEAIQKNIPVIVIASVTDESLRADYFKAGVAEIIAKPVQPVELLAKIKTHYQLRLLQLTSGESAKRSFFLQQMFSQSSVSIQVLDKDGWCERINPKFTDLFGIKPQDIEGKKYNVFTDPAMRNSGILPKLEQVFTEGKSAEWEMAAEISVPAATQQLPAERKNKVWYDSWAYPVTDENGKLANVIIQHTDITDRKMAEEAIMESEIKYRILIEQASDAIIIYSIEGTIYEVNESACKVSGYARNEFANLTIRDFLFDENLIIDEEKIEKMAAGESILFERTIKRKDGSAIDAEFNARLLPDNHILAFVRDISERKIAEQKLKDSEAKYHQLFEKSPMPVWLYNIDSLRILDVNEAAIEHYGYTKEEFLTMKISDLRKAAEIEKFASYISERKPGLQHTGTWKHLKKDGTEIDVEISSHDFETEGNQSRIVLINDVTENLKMQAALTDSEEKYRSMIERSHAGIYQTTIDGEILDCNNSFANMLGYPLSGTLTGKNAALIYFSSADREKFIHELQKKRELINHEVKLKHADGHPVYMIESCYLKKNSTTGGEYIEGTLLDITERKKAEETLEKSLKEISDYKYALDQSANVSVTDKEGNIRYVNESFCQHYGYSVEELIGQNHRIISSGFHGPAFWENFWATIQSGKVMKAEVRNRSKDGKFHWADTTIVPFVDENGLPYQYLAIRRDITERKLAEKEIVDYKFALDESSIVDVSDEKGIIQYVNENFCKISKYSKEEIIGKDHTVIDAGYHSKAFFKKLWNTIADGKVWRNEVKYKAKDGTYFWTDSTIVPFIGFEGKPFQYITIRSDITKRKEAELNMIKAIERHEILSQATSDIIWDWDIDIDKIRYSEGLRKVFGYNEEDLYVNSQWWDEHVHPDDLPGMKERLDDFFAQRAKKIQLEYRFLCADGTYKYVFDRAYAIYNEKGKIKRMIGAMQDVTYQKEEEKRIGKAVIDAQEEERNQIGMELHDNVNQILTAASLYLGLEREIQKSKGTVSETLEKSSTYIKDAIHEIRRLSHRLAPGSIKEVSLKGVFESLILSMNSDKRLHVKLHFDEFDKNLISEDIQISLYRILQEQMNNIMKHADAGSVDISLTLDDGTVSLVIADNGKGFNPKAVKKGIGLNNIRRRVEYFSGELTVNSSPGKGCEIIAQIPFKKSNDNFLSEEKE